MQWPLIFADSEVSTEFSEPNGNPEDTVLTFSLDPTDPLAPYSVAMQIIEMDDREPKVIQSVVLRLTPEEFNQMTSRLSQLRSIYQMME